MDGEVIKFPKSGVGQKPTTGSCGMRCHVAGSPLSVSSMSQATGSIGAGSMVSTDVK